MKKFAAVHLNMHLSAAFAISDFWLSSLVIISGANFTQQLNVITLVAPVNTAGARTHF
jgi:hypothetical protein